MEIINIHYKVSKPVRKYKEIKREAGEMKNLIDSGEFKGFYKKAFAIAHSQVSETPMSFFVVAPECVEEKMFKHQIIINPEIVTAPKDRNAEIKVVEYDELCFSFPFRKPKKVKRYDAIFVKYQVPALFGLKTISDFLIGTASEIFQHEYDHTQGKNIYFESENPVKWWELIGKERSKGGTHLDSSEKLGLIKSKEKPVK